MTGRPALLLAAGLSGWLYPAAWASVPTSSAPPDTAAVASPPTPLNIVFCLADDLGWADVGFHGGSDALTPFLDSMVDGPNTIHLDRYYGHSICTPSRASLLTGRYASSVNMSHSYIDYGQALALPPQYTTVAEHMKSAGYETHMVGKWHLGMTRPSDTPLERGFDSFHGFLGGGEDYMTHCSSESADQATCVGFLDLRNGTAPDWGATGLYSTELFVNQTIAILAQSAKEAPLFIYLALQSVHSPLEVPDGPWLDQYAWIEDESRRTMLGMVSMMDYQISRLVEEGLVAHGLWNDTIFVFAADNGGPPYVANSNWPMRGGKWTLWEGGTHLTAFVHGPVLTKKNFSGLMHHSDWLPTLLAAAGSPLNASALADLDGLNMWPSLISNEPSADGPRDEVLLNVDPTNNDLANASLLNDPQGWSGWAGLVTRDGWKLVLGDPGIPDGWCWPPQNSTTERSRHLEEPSAGCEGTSKDTPCTCSYGGGTPPSDRWSAHLWNLFEDPQERNEILDQPEVVAQLKARLDVYIDKATKPINMYPEERVVDPASDPSLGDGAWGPWLPDVVE